MARPMGAATAAILICGTIFLLVRSLWDGTGFGPFSFAARFIEPLMQHGLRYHLVRKFAG